MPTRAPLLFSSLSTWRDSCRTIRWSFFSFFFHRPSLTVNAGTFYWRMFFTPECIAVRASFFFSSHPSKDRAAEYAPSFFPFTSLEWRVMASTVCPSALCPTFFFFPMWGNPQCSFLLRPYGIVLLRRVFIFPFLPE